jgi:hypothetical protein
MSMAAMRCRRVLCCVAFRGGFGGGGGGQLGSGSVGGGGGCGYYFNGTCASCGGSGDANANSDLVTMGAQLRAAIAACTQGVSVCGGGGGGGGVAAPGCNFGAGFNVSWQVRQQLT